MNDVNEGHPSSQYDAVHSGPLWARRSVACSRLLRSGHSEGEFISLGCYEEKDLKVLIQHLRSAGISYLGLWGRRIANETKDFSKNCRSMGAVTSILRAAEVRKCQMYMFKTLRTILIFLISFITIIRCNLTHFCKRQKCFARTGASAAWSWTLHSVRWRF